ncbi:hypothetical protein [Atopobium minutum]|nr:hypothetical protein [Atopobium minutum]
MQVIIAYSHFVVEFGAVLLWSLALFCCGVWRCFVVEFGAVLLWSLALFCCGVWRCFVVEFGAVLAANKVGS